MSETATIERTVNPWADESSMNDEFYETHRKMVGRQALNQHKQSQIFEVGDLEHAIWVFFMAKWKNVRNYDAAGIKTLAGKAAANWCREEREKFMYFSGAFVYSGDMVERILNESVWVDLEPGVDVEGRVDVQDVFSRLTAKQQDALFRRYGLKEDLDQAGRMNAVAGLQRITGLLNSSARPERVELEMAAREV